ncbi:MAG: DUF4197 domain-containing protein [Verrucomicrobia bacterium]|nr:DUF4197 domain-containing protein [Verrucomicrobiota bacterium]
MKSSRVVKCLIVLTACLPLLSARADWRDWLNKLRGGGSINAPASSLPALGGLTQLTQEEIARGLKEALGKAVQKAVVDLGKPGGFLDNMKVKIPMPPQLEKVDKALRMVKQDKIADDFQITMNRAAERAVPVGASVLATAVSQMTLEDAKGILKGPDDAATQYFRKTSSATLTERFLPIVKDATSQVGVTANYKKLMGSAGFLGNYLNKDVMDIDGYITRKSLDGLFVVMADEEKSIRQNPAARTTDLLKKVFGVKQ